MNIREVLKRDNVGKVYKCEYNNSEYVIISTGDCVTMVDVLSDRFIFETIPLDILVNSDFTEIILDTIK